MKVAVIGAGVSGLGAAYARKDTAQVVVYEKDARLGGHANTVTVDYDGTPVDVDTGFIVYNDRNYPNLVGLLDALDVDSVQTDMSFAFACANVQWSSNFPRGVFAQKRNLVSLKFMRMLSDIRRFNQIAIEDLNAGRALDLTLGGYLRLRGFSERFETNYLLPMGAAIWSTSPNGIREAPAESFLRFFANHSLLQMVQPKWRTVRGGSRSFQCHLAMTSRARRSPSASSSAIHSATPETVACISAPPSSSSVAISPVAAFRSGGPARNTLAWLRTMMT